MKQTIEKNNDLANSDEQLDDQKANALLAAAAPEFLKALAEILKITPIPAPQGALMFGCDVKSFSAGWLGARNFAAEIAQHAIDKVNLPRCLGCDDQKANALLAAAAPELLKALAEILKITRVPAENCALMFGCNFKSFSKGWFGPRSLAAEIAQHAIDKVNLPRCLGCSELKHYDN